MEFKIESASDNDWSKIPDLIREFDLDNTDLRKEQFVVCKTEEILCGFGRLRSFEGFDLFSSLGVLPKYRGRQVAQLIIHELLKRANQKVFFVTALPAYFVERGFKITKTYPVPLRKIVEDCSLACSCLPSVMSYKFS